MYFLFYVIEYLLIDCWLIFHRKECIENLLKFNPITELNYQINWQILT